jgi:hypothetical protein
LSIAFIGLKVKGATGKIDAVDGLGMNHGTKAQRLGAKTVGQFRSGDAVRKAGEVFDIGGGRELTTCRDPTGHESLE